MYCPPPCRPNFQWYCVCRDADAKNFEQQCKQLVPGYVAFARSLLDGFLPALLISLWQGLALPRLIYLCAQSEGRHFSLSLVDRRMAAIYL